MLNFLFNPNGRISRRSYLLKFFLPYLFVATVAILAFAVAAVGLGVDTTDGAVPSNLFSVVSPLLLLIAGVPALALMWISLAIGFRRLHDVGQSGWWQFVPTVLSLPSMVWDGTNGMTPPGGPVGYVVIGLLSFLGFAFSLFLLYLMFFKKGVQGSNEFGPDPLEL
ncbi:MAG: DUF805 domain-containing protein [Pseudomonadota bacterium]